MAPPGDTCLFMKQGLFTADLEQQLTSQALKHQAAVNANERLTLAMKLCYRGSENTAF